MCGIAGYFNYNAPPEQDLSILEAMIWQLRHRGPDGFGFFQDQLAGLAHARLSIIDLEGGWQPIANEDQTIRVIFNGEIFNYIELRQDLLAKGHRFATDSDTEVLVHLYEDFGAEFVNHLNGQFAIALYDDCKRSLLLARDRMGIRPLYYTEHAGRCYFSSEIKSLFAAAASIPRNIDTSVLADIFTLWSPVGGDTAFAGIRQLQAGHTLQVDAHGLREQRQYWDIDFNVDESPDSPGELAEQLRSLLVDSVRLRLRADVPVGAYLSGGLDSSSITSLVRHYTKNRLRTFSVVFDDEVYDERSEQDQVIQFLQTDHDQVNCDYQAIARAFPAVVYHAETPILRTAPTPLYLLSSLVRSNGYKVVLTGEGADEVLGGYDLFKEAKVRAFISRQPDSGSRAMLLKRLYPYLALSPTRSASYAKQFFDTGTSPEADLFFGHGPRWKQGAFLRSFLCDDLGADKYNPIAKVEGLLSARLTGLDYFRRAQYVEAKLLLGNYLLSSQGDRMAMAHSVEGRFPFLDHRVVEFACRLPVRMKMRGLNEKYLLKKAMADILPRDIVQRKKQPYMAPDILSFFGSTVPEYVEQHLSETSLRSAGFFRPEAVRNLVDKCRKKQRQGFRENMALVGILSTQILHDAYIDHWSADTPDKLPNTRRVWSK